MPSPNPLYPTDPNVQLLVGVIFSESSGKNTGGENADEKVAIGATFRNLSIYAKIKHLGPRKCYNDAFGDGTLLSAIELSSNAYNSPAWNRIMIEIF